MENLKLIDIQSIDTNEGQQILLLFKDIETGQRKNIITKKIKHYLDDIVTAEFLDEIYINIPLFNENN